MNPPRHHKQYYTMHIHADELHIYDTYGKLPRGADREGKGRDAENITK